MTTFINAHAEQGKVISYDPLHLQGRAHDVAVYGEIGQLHTEAAIASATELAAEAIDDIVRIAVDATKHYEHDTELAAGLYTRLGSLSVEDPKTRQERDEVLRQSAELTKVLRERRDEELDGFRKANILIATQLVAQLEGQAPQGSIQAIGILQAAANKLITQHTDGVNDVRSAYYARMRGLPAISLPKSGPELPEE